MRKRNYIIGIIIILIDQLTKNILINKNIIIIPNILNFIYTKNTGAAFGIGKNSVIIILNILIIAMITIFLIKRNKDIKNHLPFILIISGSIGNLFDRIFRGYVIDFININLFDFPNFNVADICITIGIFLLIFLIIKNINRKN